MGLDTVELVFAIEESFGVEIDNADASRLETPGQVADYLCLRLRISATDPCPSQVGFYRLRRAISGTFGIARSAIRPDSRLAPLLKGDIQENWRALQQAAGARKLPRLKRKRLLFVSAVILLPAVGTAAAVAAFLPLQWAFVPFMFLALTADRFTRGMATEIPPEAARVAQLIPYVTCDSSIAWTRSTILERVIAVTSEQLGVPKEQIREDSYFVRELGAD